MKLKSSRQTAKQANSKQASSNKQRIKIEIS